jgi:hypothetical protein
LAFGGGRTTPMPPPRAMGLVQPPPKLVWGTNPKFFFLKKKKKKKKSKKIYIWQPRVTILMVSCVANVEIHQFWAEKWTEVPFPSFLIAQVPPMKKNEN